MSLELQRLKLPEYDFDIKLANTDASIYDRFRKKYIKLTPEEWVRQNFIMYLVEEKGCPQSRIKLEASIKVNQLAKRCDAIIYGKDFNPLAILECKAPSVELNQKTLRQIGVYNMKLNVNLLLITNGLSHYAIKINREKEEFEMLGEIPKYGEM